jgi:ferredoxin
MATVYCFSSTGNSLYAAKTISEKIGADLCSMTQSVSDCSDDTIGFVFPVYFWGLPKIVERFIADLNITDDKAYIFAIATYGGVIHGVLGVLAKMLARKQLELSYGNTLKSVENYIPRYEVNDNESMLNQTDEKLKVIANEIYEKRRNRPAGSTLLNKIVSSQNPANQMDCDRFFTVSDICNNCGTCRNICPVDNIHLDDEKPVFKHSCEHCLACVHACPKAAIEWKDKTMSKKRYRNPYVSLNELIAFNNTK